jgi:sec-independent protein translocase protein TatB
VFENLNFWEVGVLLLLALFIFGPERLPKVISDGLRILRNLRDMARNATNDLSRELGTDVRLEDLHPKTFIRKHLLSEEEEQQLRRPFDDAYRDLRQLTADVNDATSRALPAAPRAQGPLRPYDANSYEDRSPPDRPSDLDHPYGDPSYGDAGYLDAPYAPGLPELPPRDGAVPPRDSAVPPRDSAVPPHPNHPAGGALTHGETKPPREPGTHIYDADAT